MNEFLDEAGKTYWKEVTEWENNRCKWEATICHALAPVAEAGAMTTRTITLLVAW